MEDLVKLWGLEQRPDHELKSMAEQHQQNYRLRFMEEISCFNPNDRDRFLYYAKGDAWVCTDFVQSFEGIDQSVIRALNGRLLSQSSDEACQSVEEFHSTKCIQVGDKWFVDLPVIN